MTEQRAPAEGPREGTLRGWLAKPISRGMWFFTVFCVGLLAAGSLFLYARLGNTTREIQANRIDAIEQLCRQTNANALHIITFVSGTRPRLERRARIVFRTTPNCHTFAVNAVHPPPDQAG